MSKQLTKSKLSWPSPRDLRDALDVLRFARFDGDPLKIALAESALNELLDRHACHGCHESQTKEENCP